MDKEVFVVDADPDQQRRLYRMLEALGFTPVLVGSVAQFDLRAPRTGCRAVILNLDSVNASNRILRTMKRAHPSVNIITVSSRPFHPELEDAFRVSIFASLGLPADSHELGYLLGSIFE